MPDVPTNAAEVKEVIEQVNKPEGFPGEFTLGDGSKLKAANWEEALEIIDKRRVDTVTALRDRERQIEELRKPAPVVETPAPGSGFDQKHYWELMNSDPIQAQQYMDGIRFGVDPGVVPNLYKEVFNASQYSADNFEINQFLQNNPDFPGTKEATDIVIDTCTKEGRPLTKENLEYTYLRAVRDGQIEPAGDEAPTPWSPPSLKGGGGTQAEADIMQMVANTPDNKLDELYRKLGVLK